MVSDLLDLVAEKLPISDFELTPRVSKRLDGLLELRHLCSAKLLGLKSGLQAQDVDPPSQGGLFRGLFQGIRRIYFLSILRAERLNSLCVFSPDLLKLRPFLSGQREHLRAVCPCRWISTGFAQSGFHLRSKL